MAKSLTINILRMISTDDLRQEMERRGFVSHERKTYKALVKCAARLPPDQDYHPWTSPLLTKGDN